MRRTSEIYKILMEKMLEFSTPERKKELMSLALKEFASNRAAAAKQREDKNSRSAEAEESFAGKTYRF